MAGPFVPSSMLANPRNESKRSRNDILGDSGFQISYAACRTPGSCAGLKADRMAVLSIEEPSISQQYLGKHGIFSAPNPFQCVRLNIDSVTACWTGIRELLLGKLTLLRI